MKISGSSIVVAIDTLAASLNFDGDTGFRYSRESRNIALMEFLRFLENSELNLLFDTTLEGDRLVKNVVSKRE